MTIETRIIASIDEIQHIEISCSETDCTGRLFVDLNEKIKSEQKCPQCNHYLWASEPTPKRPKPTVYALLSALVAQRLRISVAPGADPGIGLIFPGLS